MIGMGSRVGIFLWGLAMYGESWLLHVVVVRYLGSARGADDGRVRYSASSRTVIKISRTIGA